MSETPKTPRKRTKRPADKIIDGSQNDVRSVLGTHANRVFDDITERTLAANPDVVVVDSLTKFAEVFPPKPITRYSVPVEYVEEGTLLVADGTVGCIPAESFVTVFRDEATGELAVPCKCGPRHLWKRVSSANGIRYGQFALAFGHTPA